MRDTEPAGKQAGRAFPAAQRSSAFQKAIKACGGFGGGLGGGFGGGLGGGFGGGFGVPPG